MLVMSGAPVRCGTLLASIVAGVLATAPSCGCTSPPGSELSPGGAPPEEEAPPAEGELELVWADEFDSGPNPIAPNAAHWGYEEGYVRNEEWQYYTDDIRNAYCQDGLLRIEAHQHASGTYPTGAHPGQDGSISSASLTSRGKVQFRYGYLEMRGRIDTRLGSWPAFWTLGANGEWPDNGECDIMEFYEGQLLFNVAWWLSGDPRWTARWDAEKVPLAALPSDWAREFHTWGMGWDRRGVRLYLDGERYNQWDSSVDRDDGSLEGFQQEHFFILNQAIGGTSGGDASALVYPTRYEVDYVRLYERVASE